jgi:predicted transposase YbfD/YdcC
MTNLHQAFKSLKDPRIHRNRKYKLLDIIILSILAVLCGAESYDSIALFGRENIEFLRQFLELKNGIPSHDTINRVFQLLNPREFERCFSAWAQGLKDDNIKVSERSRTMEGVIAIDGKTARGSKDVFHHQAALHSVHAWSVENGICLGQLECGEKTNEITTIPQMLDMLDIKGNTVTIDAMGTQIAIAHKIVEKGGDYILAVKGNQGTLEEEVHTACKVNTPVSDSSTVEKGHGRTVSERSRTIETRRCEVFEKGLIVDFDNRWENLNTVIKITATREFPSGKVEKH